MTTHPVRFGVAPVEARGRIHVLIRLIMLVALGALGSSGLYWLLYLLLPAWVALLVSQKGAARYLADDGPHVVRLLRWVAGAYAYLWLLSDQAPTTEPGGAVELEVECGGTPSAGSALLRLVYSLPALLLLALLSMVAGLLWIIGALAILIAARLPSAIAAFLAATLRYQLRLVAYHLSLVDRYPSLSAPATPADRHDDAHHLPPTAPLAV